MGYMRKQFELLRDALCLDFVNTVHIYGAADPREELNSFEDLVAFSQQAGAITKRHADALYKHAAEDRQSAARTLMAARECRTAIYRIFSSFATGKSSSRSGY